MSTRIARGLLSLVVLTGAAIAARAAAPIFWQTSTRADFLKGEVENLSVDSEGRLLLGPATRLLNDSSAPFIWTLVEGPGGSVYAGSGNEGRVIKFDADGKASTFFDAQELEVQALAQGPNNALYVGSSPDGKIYRVDATGASTTLFDPPDKYIWTLAVDPSGTVYAGTGNKGVIYRITPDGKGTEFYRTRTANVLSLAFDEAGNLLAGTESPGRVFRIDRQGKAFVLLDSAFQEIRGLHVAADGTLYAAAVSARRPSPAAPEAGEGGEPRAPIPSVTSEITAISVVDVGLAASAGDVKVGPRDDRRPSKGAVYRIAPDGTSDIMWESPDDSPYDLVVEPGGTLLIGTGNKGKIFRVTGDDPPRVTFLAGGGAQQVTRFLPSAKGGLYFATANPGKLFRLSTERADRGSYESEVRDAETVATWGALAWRAAVPGGSQVQLFTRSGNGRTPDDTWSDWSAPYTNANGQQMTSPKARFLQWKAILSGKETPVLTSVTAAYLQRNLRPKITTLTVYPAGTVFQRPFSTGELEIAGFEGPVPDARQARDATSAGQSSLTSAASTAVMGRRIYQKGLQTFIWKAADDNDDTLQYDVLYRREGDVTWKALKRALTDAILVWDTTSVPNGRYLVKVIASDAPSNPPGAALGGELEGGPFDVDNTPPAIAMKGIRREGSRALLSFDVRDDLSVIQRVDYSLDAERWRPIYPRDGIADSREEQFELPLDGEVEARTIVIRAVDGMNNVATARGDTKPTNDSAGGRKAQRGGER